MSGYKSFWGTCWNQMKLPVLANPLWPPCLRIPYKVPFGWVVGKGPTVMTIDFEESCLGDAMHCLFLAWMPNCHVFFISFPLPSVLQALTLYFFFFFWWKSCSNQSSLFWQHLTEFAQSPLPACPLMVFFNQVMTNWLVQNLSRTQWWGRRLWHAAIILQLSVVRPQNNYNFWDQASLPCF